MVAGEIPLGAEVELVGQTVVVQGIRYQNYVRNPSAEQAWPRLRWWVDRALVRYARRSPTYVLSALLDVERSAPFVARTVAPHLLNDSLAAFAWGHVRLTGPRWALFRVALLLVALMGVVKWVAQGARRWPRPLSATLFLIGLAFGIVWLNALVWPLPFTWARLALPSGRYLFAAMLPNALLLAGGWWALWPRRFRLYGSLLFVAALGLLNAASITLILNYYKIRITL